MLERTRFLFPRLSSVKVFLNVVIHTKALTLGDGRRCANKKRRAWIDSRLLYVLKYMYMFITFFFFFMNIRISFFDQLALYLIQQATVLFFQNLWCDYLQLVTQHLEPIHWYPSGDTSDPCSQIQLGKDLWVFWIGTSVSVWGVYVLEQIGEFVTNITKNTIK